MSKKNEQTIGTCALCKKENVILELSHIIPKFVTRRILKQSITGYMRNIFNPDQRLQDGDKQHLLCGECEDRFSKSETTFANQIFHTYKNQNQQSFEYEEWLNYFIISVNWRNLYLDIEGFKNDKTTISEEQLYLLIIKEKIMRDYLMDRTSDFEGIENHMFFFEDIKSANEAISKAEPHSFMRHSSFGYSFISHDYDGYYVVSNLSGILIFTLLKKSDIDIWERTKIENKSIYNIGYQHVRSPIASDVLAYMAESRQESSNISLKQQEILVKGLNINAGKILESEMYRDREIDKKIK